MKMMMDSTMTKMTNDVEAYQCVDIAIAGSTPVYIKKVADKFAARCGVSIFGLPNVNASKAYSWDSNPFNKDFHGNWCEGLGRTEQEAIDSLRHLIQHNGSLFISGSLDRAVKAAELAAERFGFNNLDKINEEDFL